MLKNSRRVISHDILDFIVQLFTVSCSPDEACGQ